MSTNWSYVSPRNWCLSNHWLQLLCLFNFQGALKKVSKKIVGVNCAEEPPVPIPNTEVKLCNVENTWLETTWKDKSMPIFKPQLLWLGLFITYATLTNTQ